MTSVLHVGDAAAVSGILARYQRRAGMKADVVSIHVDSLGYARFYGCDSTPFGLRAFHMFDGMLNKWRVFRKERKWRQPPTHTLTSPRNCAPWENLPPYDDPNLDALVGTGMYVRFYGRQLLKFCQSYDVIHMHDNYHLAPLIREKFPRKKIVIHHHGTPLRTATKSCRRHQKTHEEAADLVLVATGDLLYHLDGMNGTWLPIPVDTRLFHPKTATTNDPPVKIEKKILRIRNPTVSDAWADRTYRQMNLGIPYVVVDRTIPYADVRDTLCKYTHYIDWTPTYYAGRHYHTSLGLQALACGLTVLGGDFKMHSGGLPPEHEASSVVARLGKLYGV